MYQLEKDTLMDVEMYYIKSFKSQNSPFEGHYLHHSVEVEAKEMKRRYFAGDWLIEMNQVANRYIVETLEPQAMDSFFNWNFFDAILGQKEYFSAYIFEDEAAKILKDNPELRKELDAEIAKDEKLKNDGMAQLNWIYKKSAYYEDSHLLYPVGRVLK